MAFRPCRQCRQQCNISFLQMYGILHLSTCTNLAPSYYDLSARSYCNAAFLLFQGEMLYQKVSYGSLKVSYLIYEFIGQRTICALFNNYITYRFLVFCQRIWKTWFGSKYDNIVYSMTSLNKHLAFCQKHENVIFFFFTINRRQ